MKKRTANSNSAINNNKGQYSEVRKNANKKKNTRYVYTEEDLGEGMLYAGYITSQPAEKSRSSQQLW